VRDTEDNVTKAIAAYEEALRVYILEEYPVGYAMIQNNLGAAYRSLAEVKNREVNLAKAVSAYEEALKIYTAEKYPLYHKRVSGSLELIRQLMK
jgi:tetratricopeptide (TPR) repeat protein